MSKKFTAEQGFGQEGNQKIKMFQDYFKKSSKLFNDAKKLEPEEAGPDHPCIKFFNELGKVQGEITSVLAEKILSSEELELYQKNQEGPEAFGLTEQDWKEKNSDRWKQWEYSRIINNKVVDIIANMQRSGKIPENLKEKITEIPDELKQKLVDSVKRCEELLEELEELKTIGELTDDEKAVFEAHEEYNETLGYLALSKYEGKIDGETRSEKLIEALKIYSKNLKNLIEKIGELRVKEIGILFDNYDEKRAIKRISNARTFDELFRAICRSGSFTDITYDQGLRKVYSGNQVIEIIRKVIKGETSTEDVPGSNGLRDKVRKLLKKN